jgi:hypothetical protein
VKRIYISGPISADVPGVPYEERKSRFNVAEGFFVAQGLEVVNPLTIGACEDRLCSGKETPDEHGGFHHTWRCYMKYDLIGLLDCDAISLLPNWFQSPGARLEKHVAMGLGMEPVHLAIRDGKVLVVQP